MTLLVNTYKRQPYLFAKLFVDYREKLEVLVPVSKDCQNRANCGS